MKKVTINATQTAWTVGLNAREEIYIESNGNGHFLGRTFFIGWPNKASARKLANALDGKVARASFQSNGIVFKVYHLYDRTVIESEERGGYKAYNLSHLTKAQAAKLAKALRQAAKESR